MDQKLEKRKVPAPHAVTDGEIILATCDIPMSPERVYDAITTKEMEKWWGEDDVYWVKDYDADLRVGGKWTLNVVGPEGTPRPASGIFLELDKPSKLVITRKYDWEFPGLGTWPTKVTYLIEPSGEGSKVIVRHEDFNGEANAAFAHEEGWERYLDWLREYAFKETGH